MFCGCFVLSLPVQDTTQDTSTRWYQVPLLSAHSISFYKILKAQSSISHVTCSMSHVSSKSSKSWNQASPIPFHSIPFHGLLCHLFGNGNDIHEPWISARRSKMTFFHSFVWLRVLRRLHFGDQCQFQQLLFLHPISFWRQLRVPTRTSTSTSTSTSTGTFSWSSLCMKHHIHISQ